MSLYKKLDFKQLGPYQVYNINKEKGYYKLKELRPNKVNILALIIKEAIIVIISDLIKTINNPRI